MKQDLNRLDHNTKELKDVMELEEKKPPDKIIFGNNNKARKFEKISNLKGKV